ncbi:hypothetical protein CIRG_02351 [Coccidioides immitis RMSCC 2394]|uniref:Uncharacterized protein n=1 Tax=Coccidioides immitis RMSCC 2394 TaxID=404692 RepID=A0A0J6Y6K9_COCIT|nr:hypothetical protein CIRG_02351 [Coccidioides immitis RMSCC 2394]
MNVDKLLDCTVSQCRGPLVQQEVLGMERPEMFRCLSMMRMQWCLYSQGCILRSTIRLLDQNGMGLGSLNPNWDAVLNQKQGLCNYQPITKFGALAATGCRSSSMTRDNLWPRSKVIKSYPSPWFSARRSLVISSNAMTLRSTSFFRPSPPQELHPRSMLADSARVASREVASKCICLAFPAYSCQLDLHVFL